uniref:Uncharacterized protein n=1 Tax=Romanomermis culicivorax TaxID=13658 RepID=A0A915JJ51_ROMCU
MNRHRNHRIYDRLLSPVVLTQQLLLDNQLSERLNDQFNNVDHSYESKLVVFYGHVDFRGDITKKFITIN